MHVVIERRATLAFGNAGGEHREDFHRANSFTETGETLPVDHAVSSSRSEVFGLDGNDLIRFQKSPKKGGISGISNADVNDTGRRVDATLHEADGLLEIAGGCALPINRDA